MTTVSTSTSGARLMFDLVVASLVDDLRISQSCKAWVSSFDDVETIVSAAQQS